MNLHKISVTVFNFERSTKKKMKLFLIHFSDCFFYLVPTNDELVVGVDAVRLM